MSANTSSRKASTFSFFWFHWDGLPFWISQQFNIHFLLMMPSEPFCSIWICLSQIYWQRWERSHQIEFSLFHFDFLYSICICIHSIVGIFTLSGAIRAEKLPTNTGSIHVRCMPFTSMFFSIFVSHLFHSQCLFRDHDLFFKMYEFDWICMHFVCPLNIFICGNFAHSIHFILPFHVVNICFKHTHL